MSTRSDPDVNLDLVLLSYKSNIFGFWLFAQGEPKPFSKCKLFKKQHELFPLSSGDVNSSHRSGSQEQNESVLSILQKD
jgi:hypothetical protein